MRDEVLRRDGACVAPRIDPGAGDCRDQWGRPGVITIEELEADFVRLGSTGGRHQLVSDHVALCPGHHRGTGAQGGYVWATSHRREMRDYLVSLA